jgi:hemoglobin
MSRVSIYDRIGGASAVSLAVDDFYERVMGDPSLVSYFDGVDMARLKGHQRAFIAAAIGGPEVYTGQSMDEAHAGLDITAEAFGRVVDHLVATLTSLGVDNETIGSIGAALAPLQDQIVTAPSVAR